MRNVRAAYVLPKAALFRRDPMSASGWLLTPSFGWVACSSRVRRQRSTIWGATSTAGRASDMSNSAGPHSGSDAMPACIAASSPCFEAISSNDIPVNSFGSIIVSYLFEVGLAKADDSESLPPLSVYHPIQARANIAGCGVSHLIAARAWLDLGSLPDEAPYLVEVDAVLAPIGSSLCLVPFVHHTTVLLTYARLYEHLVQVGIHRGQGQVRLVRLARLLVRPPGREHTVGYAPADHALPVEACLLGDLVEAHG